MRAEIVCHKIFRVHRNSCRFGTQVLWAQDPIIQQLEL